MWISNPGGRAFIRNVTWNTVNLVDKEELDFFEDFLEEFFTDPTPPDLTNRDPDDPFGADLGDFVFILTPTIAAITLTAINYLSQFPRRRSENPTIETQLNELQITFDLIRGINYLVTRTPPSHPLRSDVDLLQFRLIQNLQQSRRYGRSPEQLSELIEIVDQLNSISYSIFHVSFCALCGLNAGMTKLQIQHLNTQLLETARTFGVDNDDNAQALTDKAITVFLSTLEDFRPLQEQEEEDE